MSTLAKKITDKRTLKLMRSYLTSGIMEGGVCSPRTEGPPQGSPLSPLLSNIVLDELDKELLPAIAGTFETASFCMYVIQVM
jgi:retron-type reverse transcriptase